MCSLESLWHGSCHKDIGSNGWRVVIPSHWRLAQNDLSSAVFKGTLVSMGDVWSRRQSVIIPSEVLGGLYNTGVQQEPLFNSILVYRM